MLNPILASSQNSNSSENSNSNSNNKTRPVSFIERKM
jgi:hypothetical protein